MLQTLLEFFTSFFKNPNTWEIWLICLGLALVFGAVWLACYWPPLLKSPWLWAVLVASAIFTHIVITFIQIPLQNLTGEILRQISSAETLYQLYLLTSIPIILIGALVQEGGKLISVVVYWWRNGKKIDPKLGLTLGAVAGVGFGIFEAQWVLNTAFASGWSWDTTQTSGLYALSPFAVRFFLVAAHSATCALAGYGLAKGWGWQFYLLASLLTAITSYGPLVMHHTFTSFTSEYISTLSVRFIIVWSIILTGAVLWIRWKNPEIKNKHKK